MRSIFDDDKIGKISLKNLQCVAKEFGKRMMTNEELQRTIDEADRVSDVAKKERSSFVS